MSRAKWLRIVEASKGEAILAVRLYNEPTLPRALEGFVVHMHLAWLYLLQAELIKNGVEFRYRDPKYKSRYLKVGGEYQTWDLAYTVKSRWPELNAVRANLEFFIKFRNRIEHRHTGSDEALFAAIGGQSHALLLNYEEELTSFFGATHTLANQLRFPVFIGTFTESAEDALIRLQNALPIDLKTFLADYDADISEELQSDPHYRLRLRVLLETASSTGDMALQFSRFEDLSLEQQAAMEELGKTGKVIVRQQVRPVQNKAMFKPSQVTQLVSKAIPFDFNPHDFTLSWKAGNYRPLNGSSDPKITRADFCIYDEPHRDYLYTQAYVNHLIDKCSTEQGFSETIGRAPKQKVITDAS